MPEAQPVVQAFDAAPIDAAEAPPHNHGGIQFGQQAQEVRWVGLNEGLNPVVNEYNRTIQRYQGNDFDTTRTKSPHVSEHVKRQREFALGLAYKAMAGTADKTAHDIVNTARIFLEFINSADERNGA
jgi:hypothetical protein